MTTELHQYDVGASIVYRVKETQGDGVSASVDVSTASGIVFHWEKPDESTTGSWSASPRSGSSDEFIYVTTASTDLSASGTWRLQPFFHLDPWGGYADIVPMEVYDSLGG